MFLISTQTCVQSNARLGRTVARRCPVYGGALGSIAHRLCAAPRRDGCADLKPRLWAGGGRPVSSTWDLGDVLGGARASRTVGRDGETPSTCSVFARRDGQTYRSGRPVAENRLVPRMLQQHQTTRCRPLEDKKLACEVIASSSPLTWPWRVVPATPPSVVVSAPSPHTTQATTCRSSLGATPRYVD